MKTVLLAIDCSSETNEEMIEEFVSQVIDHPRALMYIIANGEKANQLIRELESVSELVLLEAD